MGINDLVACIDLDDTLAQYSKALAVQMRFLQAPGEPDWTDRPSPEPPHMEARRKLIQRQSGFWRDLEPLQLGFDIVEELRELEFGLHVLTKGPKTTINAWSEKKEWCDRHIPDASVNITQDKSKFYGRVLVDDWPSYFMEWLEVRPRGLVVCVAHPWNAHFAEGLLTTHPNVLRYDGSSAALYGLKRALKAVASRMPGDSFTK
jgi:5'-nucleotidase